MSEFPYELVSRWRVPGAVEEVFAVLTDAEGLPRWWPAAYTRVKEIAPGDAAGVGRVAEIVTRGALPYELHWRIEVTHIDRPRTICLAASGDLIGRGEWQLRQDGPEVALTYDWRVRAGKRWQQRLEWLLKPLFTLNHNYVMRKGEQGLIRELARRGAK